MALKKNILYLPESLDIALPEAYFNIFQVIYRKEDYVHITVALYTNQQKRQEGNKPVESNYYELYRAGNEEVFDSFFTESKLAETGKTLIKQAYEYIKTFPDFEGAESV